MANQGGSDGWRFYTTRCGNPISPYSLTKYWHDVRERAGVPALRFHDLRHTAVSLLLALGLPPHVVHEIVGHSDIKVTMTVYAHGRLDEKAAALTRLGTAVAGALPSGVAVKPARRGCGHQRMRPVTCGSGGIRTPEPLRVSRFQGECIRPLCHASGR